jgi:hypothetical protein
VQDVWDWLRIVSSSIFLYKQSRILDSAFAVFEITFSVMTEKSKLFLRGYNSECSATETMTVLVPEK